MSCCGQSVQFPSLTKQAVNAGGAVVRVVRAAVKQQPIYVSDEMYEQRLACCRVCPHVWKSPKPGDDFLRCQLCGCGLNGRRRHKARLATEVCPDDPSRWIKYEDFHTH